LPNVKLIGDNAFRNCTALEHLRHTDSQRYNVLGKGLLVLGAGAFSNVKLRNILLPVTLQVMEDEAFYGAALTRVNLPASLTKMGKRVFERSDVMEVSFGPHFQNDSIPEGTFAHTPLQKIDLPNSVLYIREEAFFECRALTHVGGANIIRFIGRNSFTGCSKIRTCAMSDHAVVHTEAFTGCSHLKHILVGTC
jgi:hypothetical protein